MSNAQLPIPPVTFTGLNPEDVREPTVGGGGLLDLGFDGMVYVKILECEAQGAKNDQGVVGQFQYKGVIQCPPDPVTGKPVLDANGAPVNGREIFFWAEYFGQDKHGKSLAWKWHNVLIASGKYTKESVAAMITQAQAGNDPGAQFEPAKWAAGQVGWEMGLQVNTRRTGDNTVVSRANGVCTQAQFQTAWTTKDPSEVFYLARRPQQIPAPRAQQASGPGVANPHAGAANFPNLGGTPGGAVAPTPGFPGMGGQNAATPPPPPAGAPSLPGLG